MSAPEDQAGAAIIAFGAVSSLGEGQAAFSAGEIGAPARVGITEDVELSAAGLARPFVARAKVRHGQHVRGFASAGSTPEGDRAVSLIVQAALDCAKGLDRVRPGWKKERVGLVVGTSSGGMRSAERLFSGDAAAVETVPYFSPLHAAARALGMDLAPASLVLGACAAATIAIGLGTRWLTEGACDIVLAGGVDAVSVFVAAGFEALRATTGEVPPRPFRVGRDGMSLGEAAGLVALVRPGSTGGAAAPLAYVAGFGASADAVHLTAPDRTGSGLARAIKAALAEASLPGSAVDLVSAHATATPYNDAAETRALEKALGPEARPVVHPFKAQIGHTLGAAGVIETLACVDALSRGVLPAAAGAGQMDPEASVRLLEVTEAGTPAVALKLSAAFGGANAALVVTRDAPRRPSRALRPVFLERAVHVAKDLDTALLAEALGWTTDRVSRCDPLSRLALAAIASLRSAVGPLDGAGVVVGEAMATLETNLLFHKRLAEKGARGVEPRRFPYTSPNAVPGEASIAFSLTGPSFAVGAGLHAGLEALVVAADLVRSGDVARVVVVAVDDAGPAFELLRAHAPYDAVVPVRGAVATLVTAAPERAFARIDRAELCLGPRAATSPVLFGHEALLPLCAGPSRASLFAASPFPWGAELSAAARVELVPTFD